MHLSQLCMRYVSHRHLHVYEGTKQLHIRPLCQLVVRDLAMRVRHYWVKELRLKCPQCDEVNYVEIHHTNKSVCHRMKLKDKFCYRSEEHEARRAAVCKVVDRAIVFGKDTAGRKLTDRRCINRQWFVAVERMRQVDEDSESI